MKKLAWLWVVVAFACGGTSPPNLPDPGRPYELDEVYPENAAEASEGNAQLVDEVDWRSVHISFYAGELEDGHTFVWVEQSFPGTELDLYSRLREEYGPLVSPAEV